MGKNAIKNYINITYFFIFLPYLSLGLPLYSDIQPFSGVLALFYLLISVKEIRITRIALLLFSFSFLAMAWIFFAGGGDKLIYKILAYPYALIIYLFIYNTIDADIIRSVKKYAIVYILAVIFQFLFPSVYVQLFGNLVRDIRVADIGGMRGVSALTTEPSFTAFVLFTFLIIIHYSYIYSKDKTNLPIKVAMVACMTLTKAASGMALFFVFLLYEGGKKLNIRRILFLGLALTLFYFSIEYFELEQYRAVGFLVQVMSSPEKVLYEGSLFVRVYSLTAGFVSLLNNPFGLALGDVSLDIIKMTTDSIFYGYTLPYYFKLVTVGIAMPSTLGAGLTLFGVFYLVFYIFLFFPIYLQKNVPIIVKILIFAFTAQSYSFAFPLLWLLIVMCEKKMWDNGGENTEKYLYGSIKK